MNKFRTTGIGILSLVSVIVGACSEQAHQPTVASPEQPGSGVPGTPSGPRPSNEALNAPEQKNPAPLNPTAAAAATAADSVVTSNKGTVPFVKPTGLGGIPAEKHLSPPSTRVH